MSKEQRSKQELRTMVLKKAGISRQLPPGMDVSVRATRRGWEVDCAPPTASRLAFMDCCDHIASIVVLLREDFDLKAD